MIEKEILIETTLTNFYDWMWSLRLQDYMRRNPTINILSHMRNPKTNMILHMKNRRKLTSNMIMNIIDNMNPMKETTPMLIYIFHKMTPMRLHKYMPWVP